MVTSLIHLINYLLLPDLWWCFLSISSSLWRAGFEKLQKVFVTPIIVGLTFELSFWETSYIHMHVSFTLLIPFFPLFFPLLLLGFFSSLTNPLHPLRNLWVSLTHTPLTLCFSSLMLLPQGLWPPPKSPPLFQPGRSPPAPAPPQPVLWPRPPAQSAPSTSTLTCDQSQPLCLSPAAHLPPLKARSCTSARRSWCVASSGPPHREEKPWTARVPKDRLVRTAACVYF